MAKRLLTPDLGAYMCMLNIPFQVWPILTSILLAVGFVVILPKRL